jgi:hypothetical protein
MGRDEARHPPIILHEYQKKRLTEKVFRKRLILRQVFGCWGAPKRKLRLKKEKREQTPVIHT